MSTPEKTSLQAEQAGSPLETNPVYIHGHEGTLFTDATSAGVANAVYGVDNALERGEWPVPNHIRSTLFDRDWARTGIPPEFTEHRGNFYPTEGYRQRVSDQLLGGKRSKEANPSVLHLDGYTLFTLGINDGTGRSDIFTFAVEGDASGNEFMGFVNEHFPKVIENFKNEGFNIPSVVPASQEVDYDMDAIRAASAPQQPRPFTEADFDHTGDSPDTAPDEQASPTLATELLGEVPAEVGEEEVTSRGLGAWIKKHIGSKKKAEVSEAEDENTWDQIISAPTKEKEAAEAPAAEVDEDKEQTKEEPVEKAAPVINREEAANDNQSWIYDILGADEKPKAKTKGKAPSSDKQEKAKKSFGLLDRAKKLGESITSPISSEDVKDALRLAYGNIAAAKNATVTYLQKHLTEKNNEGKMRLSRKGKIVAYAGVLTTALVAAYLTKGSYSGGGGSSNTEIFTGADTTNPEMPQPSHGGTTTVEQPTPAAPTPSPEHTVSNVPQPPVNDTQEVPKIPRNNSVVENGAPFTATPTPPDVLQPGGNVWDFSRTFLKNSGYEGTNAQTAILKNYLMEAGGYSEESAHFMTPGMHMPVPDARHLRELMGVR